MRRTPGTSGSVPFDTRKRRSGRPEPVATAWFGAACYAPFTSFGRGAPGSYVVARRAVERVGDLDFGQVGVVAEHDDGTLPERQPCNGIGEMVEAELVTTCSRDERKLPVAAAHVALPVPRGVRDGPLQVGIWGVETLPPARHLRQHVLCDVLACLGVVGEERSEFERTRPRCDVPLAERRM